MLSGEACVDGAARPRSWGWSGCSGSGIFKSSATTVPVLVACSGPCGRLRDRRAPSTAAEGPRRVVLGKSKRHRAPAVRREKACEWEH